jgi:hypothetical protein
VLSLYRSAERAGAMIASLWKQKSAAAANRRHVAYCFFAAAVLALTWAAPPLGQADPSGRISRPGAVEVSVDAGQSISSDANLAGDERDTLPTGDWSDALAAPAAAHAAAYGPGRAAGIACGDLRAAFTRIFNPRAPPPPQA